MSAPKPIPPAHRIRELLTYDPLTGRMHWRNDYFKMRAGEVAGCLADTGYWVIKIEGKRYRRSRLVWAHFYGTHPEQVIHHVDHRKKNDRIANLRDISQVENLFNAGEPIGTDPDPDIFVGMAPISRSPRSRPEPKPQRPAPLPKPPKQKRIPQGRRPRRRWKIAPRPPKRGEGLPRGVYLRTGRKGKVTYSVAVTLDGTRYRSEGWPTPETAAATLETIKLRHSTLA